MNFYVAHKAHLIIIATGMVAGIIAQMFVPGRGFGLGATIVIGIVGGWVGQKFLGSYVHLTDSPTINNLLSATAGAMILALGINILRPGKEKDKSGYRNNP